MIKFISLAGDKFVEKFYKAHRDKVLKIQAELNKKHWKDACTFAFEYDGVKYFKFKNSSSLPLIRYEALLGNLIALDKRLTHKEEGMLVGIIKDALEAAINAYRKEGKISNLQNAYWAIKEIEDRQTNLMFHPDILFEIAALTIIREDETPHEINDVIREEKINLFKKHSGEMDFFLSSGLIQYLPSLEGLESKLQQLWANQEAITKIAQETYEKIHGEQQRMEV